MFMLERRSLPVYIYFLFLVTTSTHLGTTSSFYWTLAVYLALGGLLSINQSINILGPYCSAVPPTVLFIFNLEI
jgi:hypothetical protein